MNPLKEYPHLFANGKFQLRTSGGNDAPISSYEPNSNTFRLTSIITVEKAEHCTLIARPIEGMTKRELRVAMGEGGVHGVLPEEYTHWRSWLKDHAEKEHLDSNQFLCLLEMGVYPFDQSHFDDGTVIRA